MKLQDNFFVKQRIINLFLIISIYLIQTELLFALSLLCYEEAFLTLWQTDSIATVDLKQEIFYGDNLKMTTS